MDNKKRYLVVFGIIALVIVTTAASFAFFTYSRVGNTTTTIISGDIEFTYKEGENAGLANAFPVSDSVGANDTSEEYTFTVNLKSSNVNSIVNYNVYLLDNNKGTDNYFTNDQIKFALIKDGTFVAGTSSTEGKLLSSISGFATGATTGEGLALENQEIVSGKTDVYKLRIWVSDDVNYSNTDKTDDNTDEFNDAQISTGKYNGYKYSLKVKITTSYITNSSTTLENVKIENKTISIKLNDPNGLDSYAITKSEIPPSDNSTDWKTITDKTTKNNTLKINNSIITTTTINYTFDNDGTYYLHVKNKLNQIKTKSFAIYEEKYKDGSGANIPEISNGMIPVIYTDGKWIKTNPKNKWYDYDNQWWANAVTVSSETRDKYMNANYGTVVNIDDINTMWVWIPRYEYETITSTEATEIKVNFLNGTESNKTNNYITHQGFEFGNKSLTGIWVAKFEASSDTICEVVAGSIDTNCDITTPNVMIIPNVTSWRGIRVSTLDYNVRKMNDFGNVYGFVESEVDTHAMKNLEWGAVAYLSQSKYGKYGNADYEGADKEIFQNKSEDYITGKSSGKPGNSGTNLEATYSFTYSGTGASTTGNVYGIFDMSGGAYEYVMSVIKDSTGDNPMSGRTEKYNSGFKGEIYNLNDFKIIDGREMFSNEYYDLYDYIPQYEYNLEAKHHKLGDATKETRVWYGDSPFFSYNEYPWLARGGYYDQKEASGIFNFYYSDGGSNINASFRPVLVQK